jgi:hypothetical protein
MATTSWLIVTFGESGLDRAFQHAAVSPAAETEWVLSPYNRGQFALHANRRHGRREHVGLCDSIANRGGGDNDCDAGGAPRCYVQHLL